MPHVSHYLCGSCCHAWPGSKPCPKCGSKTATRLPSVTTVLSNIKIGGIDGLLHWAHKLGEEGKDLRETTQKACDVGSAAHDAIDKSLKGEQWEMPTGISSEDEQAVTACLEAWGEWKGQTRLAMVASEVEMTSPTLLYGGTLDIATVHNKRGLLDIKTGNTYPEHLAQVRAYGELWNEQHPGEEIEEYYLIRLGKLDGSFHYHRWTAKSLDPAWDLFKAALVVHKAAATLKKMV